VKKFENMFTRFNTIHERDRQIDGQIRSDILVAKIKAKVAI